MKWTMNTMLLIFFICVLVLGITDLGFVVFGGGTHSSLSNALVDLGSGKFAIYALGATNGHLFFYMYPEGQKDPFWEKMMAGACGAGAMWCVLTLFRM